MRAGSEFNTTTRVFKAVCETLYKRSWGLLVAKVRKGLAGSGWIVVVKPKRTPG